MKTTTNEGLPYAVDTDPSALPAEAQAFLLAQDARFPAWDVAFAAIAKPPCFSVRNTSPSSAISSGGLVTATWDTVDYSQGLNGNGSGISAGAASWSQPVNDGPSWWIFGATVNVALVTGTVNTNNILQVSITVTDADPNSTSGATLNYYNTGKSDITDATGSPLARAINVVTLAHFRNAGSSGGASVQMIFRDTGCTKEIFTGSRFWGFRVGNG